MALLRAAARLTDAGVVEFSGMELAAELGSSRIGSLNIPALYRGTARLIDLELLTGKWQRPPAGSVAICRYRLTPEGVAAAAQASRSGQTPGVQPL